MYSKYTCYAFLLQVFTMSILWASNGTAQKVKSVKEVTLSIHFEDENVIETFRKIESVTDFTFSYNKSDLEGVKPINGNYERQSLYNILIDISRQTSIGFKQVNHLIGASKLTRKKSATAPEVEIVTAVSVSGTVTSLSDAEPLPGVNVVVKGKGVGTVTDVDGKYNINVPDEDDILVFSSIGYTTEEVPVNGRSVINMSLAEDIQSLSEVVVIGYGEVEKRDLTGAVASVPAEQIKDLSVAGLDQAIMGKLPGVQVSQVNAAPGGGLTIRVRGVGSIGAGNDPLYVIDGLILPDGFSQDNNPLNSINPNDIASIEVLKDASATAIYGARAANGVVLITTKKGSIGKPQITFDTYQGMQQMINKIDMANRDEFIQLMKDSRDNAYIVNDPGRFDPNIPITWSRDDPASVRLDDDHLGPDVAANPFKEWWYTVPQALLDNPESFPDTDWQDAITRTGLMQNYQLSVSGGTEGIQYFVSGGYFDQEGIVLNSGFQRYSGRVNVNIKANEKLNIGLNLAPSYTNTDQTFISDKHFNGPIFLHALNAPPFLSPYDDNGNVAYLGFRGGDDEERPDNWGLEGLANPLGTLRKTDNRTNFRVLSTAYAEYEIIEGLKFRSDINLSMTNSRDLNFEPSSMGDANNPPGEHRNEGSSVSARSINWLSQNTLNYTKVFDDRHSVTALVGYSAQKNHTISNFIRKYDFPTDAIPTVNAGTTIDDVGDIRENQSEWSYVGTFGRLMYNYDSKYYVTGSIRRDGSSRFGSENKWAVFPSAAVAWRLSEENFMQGIGFLTNLKIRASYGLTGNSSIGDYRHISTLAGRNYVLGVNQEFRAGYADSKLANPELKWEKTEEYDIGLDASLFNGRLDLVADYYNRKTEDLLLNARIPTITGFGSTVRNLGSIRNKGWEFALTTRNFVKSFLWTTSVNFSINRNEVLSLGPEGVPLGADASNGGTSSLTDIGRPLASFWGYVYDGIYTDEEDVRTSPIIDRGSEEQSSNPGDGKAVDINSDGAITSEDRTVIGSPFPDFIYGMINTFSYRNFDLSIQIQGVQGNEVYNVLGEQLSESTGRRNIARRYLNYAKETGDGVYTGYFPAPNRKRLSRGADFPNSSLIEDGSYLSVRAITLGYSLPQPLINRIGVEKLRIYLNVQNALMLTDYSGYNPEINDRGGSSLSQGIDNGAYPLSRTISAGLNLSF